jgi:peptidoglycan/LPS O-acetylase OafA/YrhL
VFGYIPGLDGLRAVAVIGVMLYHGGAPFAAGGFLGIDVFFVLSGFLITSLLLGEWVHRMTIKLGQFWARRARRLLPALLVLLVAVALFARLVDPGRYASLRLDALAGLFYVANWHFIAMGTNYFDVTAPPSPLAHLWSLSIEEQFYLVWPPLALLVLRWGRRFGPLRRLWPLFWVAVAGAVASATEMAFGAHHGWSLNRLYQGTDTRAQDVFVGAALAVGLALWAQRRRPPAGAGVAGGRGGTRRGRVARPHPSAGAVGTVPPRPHRRDLHRRPSRTGGAVSAWELEEVRARTVAQILGWSGLALVLVLSWRLGTVDTFLLSGGYLLVALAVAALIFGVVTAAGGALARALGNPVFRYLGAISYGIYLWHFPLFALMDGARLHLAGYPLLLVRMAAAVAVASVSYVLVEQPIRRGATRTLTEWRAWLLSSASFVAVVAVVLAATVPTAAEAASGPQVTGPEYQGPPVRVLVLGDSVAWRVGFAMLASRPQGTYDVDLANDAIVGCGVVRSTDYRADGQVIPLVPACNTSTPAGQQWPAVWARDVAGFHPAVVVALAGRWEVVDRLVDGRWMHIGQPAYDALLRRSLEQAVTAATSQGALVVFLTSPCFDTGEQPDGRPWPEDSASRLDRYNTILREVAAGHPSAVEVDDFGAQLCPGGTFTTTFGGVQVRDADGVHVVPTAAAGQWLDQRILPTAVRVGRVQMAGGRLGPGAGH